MLESLEVVLADERETANRLRIAGHADEARNLDRVLDRVARAAEDFTTWIVEEEAVERSGQRATWFRRQYPGWEAQGYAKTEKRRRSYRTFLVPVKTDLHAVREAARRGEKVA